MCYCGYMPDTQTYYIKGVYCNKCIQKIRDVVGDSFRIIDLQKITGRFTISSSVSFDEIKTKIDGITTGTFSLQKTPPYLYIVEQIAKKYWPIFTGLLLSLFFALVLPGSTSANFMGCYFIIFGVLKIITLKGFVSMYRQYDVLAQHSKIFATLYPFVELGLGVSYFIIPHSFVLNSIVFVLMLIKAYGVGKVLVKKETVQCACLGARFSVPISYVTLGEDLLMALMAGYMLI